MRTPGADIPWPRRRQPPDPFADFGDQQLQIFVPAIMSVGLIFSLVTVVRDLFEWANRRIRDRRIRRTVGLVVGDLLPRDAEPAREPSRTSRSTSSPATFSASHTALKGPTTQLTLSVLAAIAGTGFLTLLVMNEAGWVQDLDERVLGDIVDVEWIERLDVLDLFGSTIISIGFAALIGLSAFKCRVMATVFPAMFVVAWLSTSALQSLVERTRPIDFGDTLSFPSGHMVQAVFIAGLVPTAIGVLLRTQGQVVLTLRVILGGFVVATGILRVHNENHWPVDAVAGVLLGLAVVLGSHWILGHHVWHQRCSSCPWSAHPAATPWRTGLVGIGATTARLTGFAGAAGAIVASVTLVIATLVVGLPTNPEGDGFGTAILNTGQVGLAVLTGLAGLVAFRWKALAAFIMALSATALGLMASVEYRPLLAFLLVSLLLIPAILTWISWQPVATIGSIAALAVITITSLTATALGSREVYAHYFGPTHPSSFAEPLDSAAEWLWLGGVTPRSATVVAGGLEPSDTTQLRVWSGEDVVWTATLGADGDGIARFTIDDLTPATTYGYEVTSEPGAPLTVDDPDATFETFAEGAQDLEVLLSSCARNESNGAVFDVMRDEDPDLYIALGDLHYANLSSNDPEDHLRQYGRSLSQPGQAALFSSVPTAYIWDDHDYGPNDADSSSPAREGVSVAYRQAVPHYGVDPDPAAPIAQAFTVGRVRFVMSDTRSHRTATSMLGAAQVDWLIDELVDASRTHALVVWANPTPWISSAGVGADDWSGYPDERRTISDALAGAGVENLVMVSGDAHMIGIDDGTNSDYSTSGDGGFPVLHAAALDRPGSVKGGPYSHGAFPGSGQYGKLRILDDGGETVDVRLSGHNWRGEEVVSYELTIPTTRPSIESAVE